MSLILVQPPALEIMTLAEAKLHLRIETDAVEEDALLDRLIVAARQRLDGWTGRLGRALITQTWRLDLPCFRDRVTFPLPPLQSVEAVEYWDRDDVLQTVSDSVYEVLPGGTAGGRLVRRPNQSWPVDVSDDRAEPVRITFNAGYGDDWNAVPEPIRQALLFLVAHWFEHRGDEAGGMPAVVEDMIAPYRVPAF